MQKTQDGCNVKVVASGKEPPRAMVRGSGLRQKLGSAELDGGVLSAGWRYVAALRHDFGTTLSLAIKYH